MKFIMNTVLTQWCLHGFRKNEEISQIHDNGEVDGMTTIRFDARKELHSLETNTAKVRRHLR